MTDNTSTLDRVIESIRTHWKGLDTQTIVHTREQLTLLTQASISEPWLTELHKNQAPGVELYRDPEHGFILLAHVEKQGLYRMPHNHGAGWVFYAVQHGQMQMSTYLQITNPSGETRLVSRGENKVEQGEVNVYLTGDIHDTLCLSEYVLMFRLTSSDFEEEKRAGRLIRFKEPA